ncbi:uncharacterized protein MONBRDRAFT_22367 [Monosiga brevicollis MX1]|uniref:Pre-mRNA-splicing factor Syf1/CRNKL1-like C-terminal HAT-repeats domain-containing protein n=1 Tax=Monosiga brevicollis TaxID=81824 RepID=A9UQD4_MONBE|nr:uncharacterized protein MONBRDRAFT_22367 [Monosiga brevicollis MX1]EDQ93026.1 predicted protein [Monosiga brevicollis MX1]|eukprot:XP_001742788.1 hypothetical protein [Monosiga brevicollis MX1]
MSVEDHERAVMASPNSSFTWIQYIAFFLQLTELDKARAVAHRALKTIAPELEDEKMNVWVARLNLENSFGSQEALDKVFADSCQRMDALKMHMHLLGIYMRSEKHDQVEEVFQAMLKKFKSHKSVWLKYAEYLLNQKQFATARALLERALKSVPKHDHVDLISKFGILEFKLGDVERGRTIFENVVTTHPKRVDMWNIWIDQELRIDDEDAIRALFERVVTLRLSTKKMKHFFKRFLEFEKEQDNADGIERVKNLARAYVEEKAA